MAWVLERWKSCDGGCSIRAPSFPDLSKLGTIPGQHPEFMAGDRYKLDDAGGTSPDGMPWTGGNALHKELWQLYEHHGRNADRIELSDLKSLPLFGDLFGLDWPPHGLWKGRAIQWFLDRDFGWPVRTPHIQAVLDRMARLGIWDSTLYDSGIEYGKTYTNEQRAAFGQDFDIDDSMTLMEKQLEEPACCHYWQVT